MYKKPLLCCKNYISSPEQKNFKERFLNFSAAHKRLIHLLD
jgi:hypothetical protein